MTAGNLDTHSNDDPSGDDAKALGAFYTDTQIAEFLVRWAVRFRSDTVIDPSFGGGVFLRAACQRISELRGAPDTQVSGVEIDSDVHRQITEKLVDEFRITNSNLVRDDFFNVDAETIGLVDAVVGNPPFIRYQRFSGDARRTALECAAAQGVKLTKLASSWAPFVIHGVSMLKPGGRLAFVLPMEIAYASYAMPVLEFLRTSFREVTFLTFEKKLFPDLSEDTLLLLAEDRGYGPAQFLIRDFIHAGMLRYQAFGDRSRIYDSNEVDSEPLSNGKRRLVEYHLPVSMRTLYSHLKRNKSGRPLGHLADIGIGYVTGNNKFFHLDPATIREWSIPGAYLRPAVRRG
ncbi:MAG: N-6 DNA methylase, partial [Proteobacteria bacterium]|nr:N-6 DNA methylase [Pseudomonadota bacterium]